MLNGEDWYDVRHGRLIINPDRTAKEEKKGDRNGEMTILVKGNCKTRFHCSKMIFLVNCMSNIWLKQIEIFELWLVDGPQVGRHEYICVVFFLLLIFHADISTNLRDFHLRFSRA